MKRVPRLLFPFALPPGCVYQDLVSLDGSFVSGASSELAFHNTRHLRDLMALQVGVLLLHTWSPSFSTNSPYCLAPIYLWQDVFYYSYSTAIEFERPRLSWPDLCSTWLRAAVTFAL